MTRPTCHVTMWDRTLTYRDLRRSMHRCGLPVVAGRLCARHEAERVRLLGGAA